MYDNLYNELVAKGLTNQVSEELEGYYLFNNSQSKPARLEFTGEVSLTPLDLNNQNPTLNLENNKISVCLSPKPTVG